jgi:hypothetical protein
VPVLTARNCINEELFSQHSKHTFIFLVHPSRTIFSHLDKAIMDLSQLVNPTVTFSKAALEDILTPYYTPTDASQLG